MNLGVAFAPLVAAQVLWAAVAAACILSLLLFVSRSRGAVVRALALALVVLALANPSLTREDRDPLSSVAVVVVDKSPSQNFGDRALQTAEARTAIVGRLSRIPGLDVRVIEAGQSDGETDGTRLFTALGSALADVPSDRVAGAIMITDGRVHDVPADAGALGFAAPIHALITGSKDERDRRVALIAARASAVCRARSPKFWLGLLSTTTTATELSGSRSSRVSDGLASASTTRASASARTTAPRLRDTNSSNARMQAATTAAQRTWAATSGAKATPRFTFASYCPNRSSSAGTCTWSAL